MDLGLKDRVAVVCGASQGMGRAIAAGLAAEGARVLLVARNADRLAAGRACDRRAGARSDLATAWRWI